MRSTEREVLRIRGLSKTFGTNTVLEGVDLTCDEGEIKALVGPNGAGKTTLFDIAGGLLTSDGGDVLFRGRSILRMKPHEIARLGVGRLFQELRLFGNLSVAENVLLPLTPTEDAGPFATAFHPRRISRHESRRSLRASTLLRDLGMLDHSGRRASDLSFGQQRLVALARTLARRRDVLLLDEPSAGLHASVASRVAELVRKAAAGGAAVILIEHDLSFVAAVTDRVALLAQGRILVEGDLREVTANTMFRESFLGPRVNRAVMDRSDA